MVVAVTATLLGLRALGPAGRSPLSSVVGHGAILVVIAVSWFSMRRQRSVRQRRLHAAAAILLALLWLIEAVGYLIGWW